MISLIDFSKRAFIAITSVTVLIVASLTLAAALSRLDLLGLLELGVVLTIALLCCTTSIVFQDVKVSSGRRWTLIAGTALFNFTLYSTAMTVFLSDLGFLPDSFGVEWHFGFFVVPLVF